MTENCTRIYVMSDHLRIPNYYATLQNVGSLESPRLIKQTEFYFRSATALYPTKCRLRIARHLSLVCQSVALPKGSRVDLILSNLFGFEVSGENLSSLRPRQINLSRFRVFNHLF